jgi:hypothetical protein
VNLILAGLAFAGGALLLGRNPSSARPRLDIPGVLLVSSGMFCLVYGLLQCCLAQPGNALPAIADEVRPVDGGAIADKRPRSSRFICARTEHATLRTYRRAVSVQRAAPAR